MALWRAEPRGSTVLLSITDSRPRLLPSSLDFRFVLFSASLNVERWAFRAAALLLNSQRLNFLSQIDAHGHSAGNILPATATPEGAAAGIVVCDHDDRALDACPAQALQTLIHKAFT